VDAAVEVTDLAMTYGDRRAVDGLSLDVRTGSVTAIVGPNGAGKTTTVETCEGYRRPQAGRVRVLGLDPVTDHAALAPRVGVMLQSGGTWSGSHADEMLAYVASLYRQPLPVPALIERLGLGGCGRTPYRRLSGGQQQRLSLALAVVGRPELVFLDEPTAGLDPQARHATWELVEEMAAAGVTVVLTTHYMEEAERLADQVHVMDEGRVLTSGSVAQLTERAGRTSLRFHAKPGLELVALAAALPEDCSVAEGPEGVYRVTGDVTPHILATVSGWCAAHDVMPDQLGIEKPTLEDVFLDLTGRTLRG